MTAPVAGDYRLDLTVKNNRILHYMKQMGYRTVNALCRSTGLSPVVIGQLVNLKAPAVDQYGEWRVPALRLAEALACDPSDLWTDAQRTAALETNRLAVEVAEVEVSRLFVSPSPVDVLLGREVRGVVAQALASLSPREEKVVRMWYGLEPYFERHTSDVVGQEIGVTRNRVYQIKESAFSKLKHNALLAEVAGGVM